MIEDKIFVRFIDRDQKLKVIAESVTGINYVEQLVYRILDKEGVGPVYRCLFALRLVGELVWLAPNAKLRDIHKWSLDCHQNGGGPSLELRMRFRPACYKRLAYVDKIVLDIIFAQIRTDFLKTRFNEAWRSCVLLDEPVVVMIVLDLIRHSIENDIPIEQILEKVDPRDFLPRRAPAWQRAIMFHIDKQINLRKALRLGYDQCDKNVRTLKRKYIELFLTNAADKYGSETYIVNQLQQQSPRTTTKPNSSGQAKRLDKLKIRVQFSVQQGKTNCLVEIAPYKPAGDGIDKLLRNKRDPNAPEGWVQVCDIATVNHATIRHNIVQLAGDNGLVKYQFKDSWHAESFLSILDGYFRLMRKWNLNPFCDIWSPSLHRLKQLESHGPIGFGSACRKLNEFERPGDFIVRQCNEVSNRFLIDTTLFHAKAILTLHMDWLPEHKKFRLIKHTVNRDHFEVAVKTPSTDYAKLKLLIRDIEINFYYKSEGPFRKQLKHWIQPEDDDHDPALLLSLTEAQLDQMEQEDKFNLNGPIGHLPHMIPRQFLTFMGRRLSNPNNGLRVDLAMTNESRTVVIKSSIVTSKYSQQAQEWPGRSPTREEFAFHVCADGHGNKGPGKSLSAPNQIRMDDWALVKSPLFAETIGYVMSAEALVQEYFPGGRLDEFLMANQQLDCVVKLSICFQLIQSLLFLQQRKFIHGKIRCHNVMIQRLHPIRIKLTDNLGSLDVEQDQAFIPPEYFRSTVCACVKKFYTGIDVWAIGTTMWQVYTNGTRPPSGRYANTLTQPTDCPDGVWNLIEACWVVEPKYRANPQALFRDLCDLFVWEKGANEYFYISTEDSATATDAPGSLVSPASSLTNINDSSPRLNQNQSKLNNNPAQTSTNGKEGSQTNSKLQMIKAQIGYDTVSTSSSGSGTTTTSRSDAQIISNHSRVKKATWMNFINLGKQQRHQPPSLPPRSNFADLFGSRSSFDSCATPSGSDMTKLTVLDLENISDAFDRCVWHIDSKRLKLGAEIGRGSGGVVLKGIISQFDGEDGDKVVAVKCIDRNSSSFDLNHIEDLRREFDILKNLNHENIVKALGYVEESQMMLVFEYMPLGSLLSCVKNLQALDDLHKLPLRKYGLDIAKGMEYLESMKIVHRDLALRNILLSSRNDVKICDFGLAKSLGSDDFYRQETERALPLKWYAPETIGTRVFTHKSDVWSYGVVLWEIYTGGDSPQYSGTYANLSETLKHERLPLPSRCPRQMYDLMLKCWTYNPDDRLAFRRIREILERLN